MTWYLTHLPTPTHLHYHNLMLAYCRTWHGTGIPPLFYPSTSPVGDSHILGSWGMWTPLYCHA